MFRRSLLLLALTAAAALGVAGPADAATTPAAIGAGVTIGGVDVSGLTAADALARVQEAYFRRPLLLRIGISTFRPAPWTVKVGARLGTAVNAALLRTTPGDVPVAITWNRSAMAALANAISRRTSTAPTNARWRFFGARPKAIAQKPGFAAPPKLIALALRRELRWPLVRTQGLVVLRKRVRAAIVLADLPPAIVISRAGKFLRLWHVVRTGRTAAWRTFGVATGQASYPTPGGLWSVVEKQRSPWWYPPDSPWAKGLKPIPPGPGNPLGTRWMGLSASGVGIHGTPDDASIGYSASHGCIRMHIPDAEWLFEHVVLGTPVLIV